MFRSFPLRTALLAIILCCLEHRANAQGLIFDWAGGMGSTGLDEGHAIAIDAQGNTCTVGVFEGTVDLDPGGNVASVTSAGDADVLISKLDVNGAYVWGGRIGGTGNDNGAAIAVDASGAMYLTGHFTGTVDFDPGPDSYPLTAAGGNEAFVLKLDADGAFVWAFRIGTAAPEVGRAIAVDPAGDLYVTGSLVNATDMDPGPNEFLIEPAAFLLKVDSDGQFIWALNLGETGEGYAVDVDASSNVYTSGTFFGTSDMDPGPASFPLTAAGGDLDVFITKLDENGNFVWARQLGGAQQDQVNALAVDDVGNVHLSGSFLSSCNFDPGVSDYTLSSTNNFAAFTAKYDGNGAFAWAYSVSGPWSGNSNVGFGVAVGANGTVTTTGNFLGSVDFDPGPGSFVLNSGSNTNIFVEQVDSNGAFLWAGQVGDGTLNYNTGRAVAVDAIGNVRVTGSFVSTNVDLDPGPGVSTLSAMGGYDAFVLALEVDPSTGLLGNADPARSFRMFPNPASNHITLQFPDEVGAVQIRLFDAAGRVVLQKFLLTGARVLDLSKVDAGVYYLAISSHDRLIYGQTLVVQ